MKFSTSILTLFAAVSAVAAAAPYDSFEKCKSEVIKSTSDCIAEIHENREQACAESRSQRCQYFFKHPLSVDTECQNLTQYEKSNLTGFVKERYADNNIYCQKTANGKYCPFGDILVTDKRITEDVFMKAIVNTCQYKECLNLTIKSMRTTINNTKYHMAPSETYLNWYKSGLAYLKSNECSTVLKKNNRNSNSNSNRNNNRYNKYTF